LTLTSCVVILTIVRMVGAVVLNHGSLYNSDRPAITSHDIRLAYSNVVIWSERVAI
jgi:hypothetical protein